MEMFENNHMWAIIFKWLHSSYMLYNFHKMLHKLNRTKVCLLKFIVYVLQSHGHTSFLIFYLEIYYVQ